MDLVRIVRSLEEFLYEVMTWLVFYPRTLWRSAAHPIRMLEYANTEQSKPESEQFLGVLSAPLFLMLSLLISHLIEVGVGLNPFADTSSGAQSWLASDQTLVIVRSLLFAVPPLMFALEQVKDSGQPLDRRTLRGPFYGACYPAAVFGLVFSTSATVARAWPSTAMPAWALMVAIAIWYLAVQAVWLRRSNRSWGDAIGVALACGLKASAIVIVAAVVLAGMA